MTTSPGGLASQSEQDSGLLVIDLEKRQSRKRIKALRQGHGKLLTRIEGIVAELVTSGTIKGNAQPVVIIVREAPPWPFPD
jgi:hypothetical protein